MEGTAAPTAPAPTSAPDTGGEESKQGPGASLEERRAAARASRKKADAPKAKGIDPKAEARRMMRERKAELRLATSDGETVEDEPKATDVPTEPKAKAEAKPWEKGEAKAGDAEPEGDKAPSWAKKLRQENDDARRVIAQHERTQQEWGKAVEAAEARFGEIELDLEDARSEAEFWKSAATQLQAFLDKAAPGRFVPESLQLALRDLEIRKMQRRQGAAGRRTEQATQAQQRAAAVDSLKAEVAALAQKHPELDHTKNPDARAFLARWLKRGAPREGFDEEIADFIAAQRWKASEAGRKPAKPTTTPAGPRPGSSVSESQAATINRSPQPGAITNRTAHQMMREYRAAKAR